MSKFKLPADHVAKLKQVQRDLHDLLAEFDAADECGIDCQEYRRMHQEAVQAANKLLEHYGPGMTG